jgi:hypothetical protein
MSRSRDGKVKCKLAPYAYSRLEKVKIAPQMMALQPHARCKRRATK